jgi:hypothetical protein
MAFTVGCALPTKSSLRPRSVELYGETGQMDYGPKSKFRDYRYGISVGFQLEYEDEAEE